MNSREEYTGTCSGAVVCSAYTAGGLLLASVVVALLGYYLLFVLPFPSLIVSSRQIRALPVGERIMVQSYLIRTHQPLTIMELNHIKEKYKENRRDESQVEKQLKAASTAPIS